MKRIVLGVALEENKNSNAETIKQVIEKFLSFKKYVLIGYKDDLQ